MHTFSSDEDFKYAEVGIALNPPTAGLLSIVCGVISLRDNGLSPLLLVFSNALKKEKVQLLGIPWR